MDILTFDFENLSCATMVSSNLNVLEMHFVAGTDLSFVGSRWCLSFHRYKIVYSWIV
jgi:hypothetical protein